MIFSNTFKALIFCLLVINLIYTGALFWLYWEYVLLSLFPELPVINIIDAIAIKFCAILRIKVNAIPLSISFVR